MTQPTLASDRGIRISKVRLVHQSGEFDEYSFASGMLNILYGVRNSSKSTTLRVIDYCLGDRDNPVGALGAAIADEYVEVATELRIDGRPYTLSRALTHGRMSKVNLNGVEIPASSFSDWVLGELGWPNLHIPLGLNPATAAQLTPLSFRSALRHVHRNEDSWISFANKEQEFTRRAVVSQLLGFARTRTSDAKRVRSGPGEAPLGRGAGCGPRGAGEHGTGRRRHLREPAVAPSPHFRAGSSRTPRSPGRARRGPCGSVSS